MATTVILALALAMDALAVAVAAGIATPAVRLRDATRLALVFGAFQAGMPVIGWSLGRAAASWISAVDHWIACGLLTLIGLHMLREGMSGDAADGPPARFAWPALLVAGLATSIDALAAGLAIDAIGVGIGTAAGLIGGITAGLSLAGVLAGRRIGGRMAHRAGILAGVVLILIGLNILRQHLSAG